MNRYKLYKAGVDVNGALSRLGGDKELYEELLQTFKKENRLDGLKAALDSGDCAAAFAAAHAMKGEVGNMGFSQMYEPLSELVEKLRTGDLADTELLYERILEAYEALVEAIG